MRKIVDKEEGFTGIAGFIFFFTIFALTLLAVYLINSKIVNMSWEGFVTYMKPNYLYPDLNGEYGTNNAVNVMLGAKYLYENIVMRQIVNSLLLVILLFTGLAYIYADLFEQFMGKIKTLLPRLVFGLILAYTSIYIFQGLMLLAKGGYLLFYNAPVMGAWKNPNYLYGVAPDLRAVHNMPIVENLTNAYWHYLWIFVIMVEALSLLMFVAFRIVMIGVLLVLLPVASLLLIHPWTQQIGSRIWWLMISLLFVPIAMIIPLMLSTVVSGSISFMIASLTAVLGSIYLLAKEPFILGGLGFQRASSVLTGGIIGGGATGNLLAPTQALSPVQGYALQSTQSFGFGHPGQVQMTPEGAKLVGGFGFSGYMAGKIYTRVKGIHRGRIEMSQEKRGGGEGEAGSGNMQNYVEENGGVEE